MKISNSLLVALVLIIVMISFAFAEEVQELSEAELLEFHNKREEVASADRYKVKGSWNKARLLKLYTVSLTTYCSNNGLISVNTCFWCKKLQNPHTILVRNLYNAKSHTYGYVAYQPENKRLTVAFRGTINAKNWLTNVDALYSDLDGHATRRVHKGFYKAFNNVRNQLKAAITTAKNSYDIEEVYVIGHSLGGAIATISIAELSKHFSKQYLHLITFGSPRVGNMPFVKFVHDKVYEATRVINRKDPVPHLPQRHFSMLSGKSLYFHVGREAYLKDEKIYSCQFDEICAETTLLPSIGAHTGYFGRKTSETKEC